MWFGRLLGANAPHTKTKLSPKLFLNQGRHTVPPLICDGLNFFAYIEIFAGI